MNVKILIRKILKCLLIICCLYTIINFIGKPSYIEAIDITLDEAYSEQVDNLRYGYNVTAGKALSDDALLTTAPILKPINEGLYKYISKSESTSTKVEAGNTVTSSAIGILEKVGSIISGGISSSVYVVNLDISTTFDTDHNLDKIYEERYEYYYEKIVRYKYEIREDVDLREYLTDAFKRDLYSVSDPEEAALLFKKYGTKNTIRLQDTDYYNKIIKTK